MNPSGPEAIDLLKEFLDSHASPSVIVEASSDFNCGALKQLALVYTNPSFTTWIGGSSLSDKTFTDWVEDCSVWTGLGSGKTKSFPYARLMWVASRVGKRWGLLQSQTRYEELLTPESDISSRPHKRPRTSTDEVPTVTSQTVTPEQEVGSWLRSQSPPSNSLQEDGVNCVLDWTRYDTPNQTEFVKWLRSFDWSHTQIGPMQDWSPVVRQTMISIVANPEARCVYFGLEEPLMLYNEACSKLLGHLHPAAMGALGSVGAGEAWKFKYEGIKEVWAHGVATVSTDFYHPIPRSGLPFEEAYFCWSITPILDNSGRMMGVQKEFWETTVKVVQERRDKTMEKAATMISYGDTLSDYWRKVKEILQLNEPDFPFCLMYSVPQNPQPEKVGDASAEDLVPKYISLEGTVGLDENHPMAVKRLNLRSLEYLIAKHFRTAWIRGEPVSLSDKDSTLPKNLQVTIEGRGLGWPCRSAMLCPIKRVDGPGSVGFLLFGLNPQRPYDYEYQKFLTQLMDKFEKAAARILVLEEREKLKQQWQKARDQERIFTRLAEFASVGLAIYEPNQTPRWKNPTFVELTKIEEEGKSRHLHRLPIHPEDNTKFEELMQELADSRDPKWKPYFPFRVQKDPSVPVEEAITKPEAWRWLLAHASGEFECRSQETNEVKSRVDERPELKWIGIYVTDITPQQQEIRDKGQRLKDALETKKQSEDFIDLTCHEMRNPLSAIIQSADAILTSFDPQPLEPEVLTSFGGSTNAPEELQAAVLDSAETILLCAQHQKRIVDDILTLSKLDSDLLLIAPDRIQPVALIERAISMYENELADAGIAVSFLVERSYAELNIDFVNLDPARFLQILINLLTNAIKFTRKENTKRITVVLGASISPPSTGASAPSSVSFIPPRTSRTDMLSAPEWGTGDILHLQIDVCDTGKGMTGDEMKQLFQRFGQASAKTYSQYGGSGLELFISRELTELQGGQIGVDSAPGKGSTFAFYIKARRHVPEASEEKVLGDPSDDQGTAQVKSGALAHASVSYVDAAMAGFEWNDIGSSKDLPKLPSDLHVLIVEDNVLNQKVVAQGLRRAGCTVHVANHGLECLDFLEKSGAWRRIPKITLNDTELPGADSELDPVPLSIVLLDQEMPLMDGLSCVRRIRELQLEGKLLGHVPVIGCTGNARREQVMECLEAGMVRMLTSQPTKADTDGADSRMMW